VDTVDDHAWSLLGLLGLNAGVAVGDGDAELLSAGNDLLALPDTDVSADLGAELAVVQEKDLEFLDVGHAERLEAVGELVAGLFVVTVTDVHHLDGAFEATADTAINTAGSAPGGL